MWTLLSALISSQSIALGADLEPVGQASFKGSYWRLGMTLDASGGVRMPMLEEEGNPLRQDTGLKVLASTSVNPAYARAGGSVVFSPLAVMDLTAHGGISSYFGTYQTIIGFSDAGENYGNNEALEAYVTDTGNRAKGSGWQVGGSLTLKAKAGPMLVLINTDLTHWAIDSDVEGDWFFEREQELMLALGGDQVLSINGVFLYELDKDPEDGRNLRIGNLTTRRTSMAGEDTLLRSGLLAVLSQNEHWSHTFLVQPYLVARAFDVQSAPFTAYVLKYTL
jgi:hypothetical protein